MFSSSHPQHRFSSAGAPSSGSVLVVILNWNTPGDTLDATAAVLAMDYPDFRILLVDNGSTDDSIVRLREIEGPRVKLVASPENLGYTGGCNLGFDRALALGVDYVWLLNSDSLTEPGTLSSLVRCAQSDDRIGMVSPLIASMRTPSRYIYAGGYYNSAVPSCETTRNPEIGRQWSGEHADTFMLLGTALLVSSQLIRTIGKLDEKLFAYWEDSDFSMRSNAAGFRNVIDFNATVLHNEKFPTDTPENIKPHFWYYLARNETRFWKKHLAFPQRLRPLWWAFQTQRSHLKMLSGAEPSRQAILTGLWHGWIGRTGHYRPEARMPRPVAFFLRS